MDVIVAAGAQLAAKDATSTIPIVSTAGSDPVKSGVVSSLSRPGGNLTGVNTFTVGFDAKRLELIRELLPRADAIAFLVNPTFVRAEPALGYDRLE